MGLDIFLETEQGTALGNISDPTNILFRLIEPVQSELALLKYVDPYGDTVFNHMQAADLLRDIEYLRTTATDVTTMDLLLKLGTLISHLDEQPHRYLKVYGD